MSSFVWKLQETAAQMLHKQKNKKQSILLILDHFLMLWSDNFFDHND